VTSMTRGELAAWSGSRARREDFRFVGADLLVGDEEDGSRPGGKQVEARHEFRDHRREKGPVPAEEADEESGNDGIEDCVGGRDCAGSEERKRADLEGVCGDGNQPGEAVLWSFDGFEEVVDAHDNLC
jgi:hypothetical protein